MKSILFSILFLLVPKMALSQYNITANDDAVYLDSLFKTGTEKNHKYIRVVKDYYTPKKKSYEVKDYYKSGIIAMSGTTINKDKIIKTGVFAYYYENGNKKEEREYAENEVPTDKPYKLNQYWDENNNHLVIDGNGVLIHGNKIDIIITDIYKDGNKDGICEEKNLKLHTTFSEKYEKGKFISGIRTFEDNTTSEYTAMETKPVPKKGLADFYDFIGRNYRTPNIQGLNGKVYITFVVEKNGKIVEPKVLRDLGNGTGAEAIRVVMAYDGFIPGEQRGQKIRCSFALPINIESAGAIIPNIILNTSEMMKNTNPNWH